MKREFTYKSILKIIIGCLVICGIVIIVRHKGALHKFKDISYLLHFLQNKGRRGFWVMPIIFMIKPLVVVFPAALLSVACGIVWGPFEGFLVNMMGFFISGTSAFVISRILGRDVVEKIVKNRAVKLEYSLEKRGFLILLLLRLPPILPYDPLSYACGLTNIKYVDFITSSLIGVVPETLCYSIMGMSILEPSSFKFIIPAVLLLISTCISGILFKKAKHLEDN